MPRPWLTLALLFAAGLLCRAPWPAALAAGLAAAALHRRAGLALPTVALAAGLLAGGSPDRWAAAAPGAPPPR
ncbi:MAG: hypothetical protein H6702_10720 [Myxococcales bacterium]|nr:hypothetical protein [Myxococcales bacterium]